MKSKSRLNQRWATFENINLKVFLKKIIDMGKEYRMKSSKYVTYQENQTLMRFLPRLFVMVSLEERPLELKLQELGC